MKNDFIITSIRQIILVDHTNFVGTKQYKSPLKSNELIFHFSGDTIVNFNQKTLHTTANTVRFLPQGENRQYEVQGNLGVSIDIFFQADHPIAEEAFVIDCKKNQKLAPLFQKAFSVWIARREGYYMECLSILYKIFAELQKSNYIPEKKFAVIRPAVAYIRENFLKESISSKKLEELCGVSYSYIKQLFAQALGASPQNYALQLKMNYAADLLAIHRYSVGQVAELCSYQGPSFFSRQFKAFFGCAPSTYRNKAKAISKDGAS